MVNNCVKTKVKAFYDKLHTLTKPREIEEKWFFLYFILDGGKSGSKRTRIS